MQTEKPYVNTLALKKITLPSAATGASDGHKAVVESTTHSWDLVQQQVLPRSKAAVQEGGSTPPPPLYRELKIKYYLGQTI